MKLQSKDNMSDYKNHAIPPVTEVEVHTDPIGKHGIMKNTNIETSSDEIERFQTDPMYRDRACGIHTKAAEKTGSNDTTIVKNNHMQYPHGKSGTRSIHYYCPRCHATYVEGLMFDISSTSSKVTCYTNTSRTCDNCEFEAVEIDEGLVDIIVKLNMIGLETEYCCEGHGFEDPAYISFSTNANNLLKDIDAPYMWGHDSQVQWVESCEYSDKFATKVVDSWHALFNQQTWARCNGVISIAYRGMLAAVDDIEDEERNGIYRCTSANPLTWEKVIGSENMRKGIRRSDNIIIRPTLSENPVELQKIYGCHFDIYKNLYMNALRAWVDNVQTILIERYKITEN